MSTVDEVATSSQSDASSPDQSVSIPADALIIVAARNKLAKNAFPSSCAALPGITTPMGLSAQGLPMGPEMDGKTGEDTKLLRLARVIGVIPTPSGVG
jgi:Asp-tRNA(Asn)/Glu-tRNA(Gln) amidotransferase A subunit family amidase